VLARARASVPFRCAHLQMFCLVPLLSHSCFPVVLFLFPCCPVLVPLLSRSCSLVVPLLFPSRPLPLPFSSPSHPLLVPFSSPSSLLPLPCSEQPTLPCACWIQYRCLFPFVISTFAFLLPCCSSRRRCPIPSGGTYGQTVSWYMHTMHIVRAMLVASNGDGMSCISSRPY
jgi:hypothetical protein